MADMISLNTNSNTTLVKVKFFLACRLDLLLDIQIQHLLKLNSFIHRAIFKTFTIQIQHLLKLNVNKILTISLKAFAFKYNTC